MKKADKKMEEQALRRAEVIIKVQSGLLTADQAAGELGVSRRVYHKWQKRALEGMMDSLLDRPPGRPRLPRDQEKEAMQRQIKQLEEQMLLEEERHQIHFLLEDDLRLRDTIVQRLLQKKKAEKEPSTEK